MPHTPYFPKTYSSGLSPSTLMAKSISFTLFSSDVSARGPLERCVSSTLLWLSASNPPIPSKVRVVQHKQTRDLYALKYINKTKCVKMKAVPNVIQERRLLEEVCSTPSPLAPFHSFLSCPPSLG